MTLFVPAESVMKCVVITLFMTLRYPRNNSNVICERISEIYPRIDRGYLLF